MNATNIKSKFIATADGIMNSKVYKAVEKAAVVASATVATVGASAINSLAADEAIKITVDDSAVLTNAQPFLTPAVTILCIVGGIKLGWSFLKRSFH